MSASFWLGPYEDQGRPDARYSDGHVWLGPYEDQGRPDARYSDGRVWRGPYEDQGRPDARYSDGRVWLGPYEDQGRPDARYDGDDDGAAAAAAVLLLLGGTAYSESDSSDEEASDFSESYTSGSDEESSSYSYTQGVSVLSSSASTPDFSGLWAVLIAVAILIGIGSSGDIMKIFDSPNRSGSYSQPARSSPASPGAPKEPERVFTLGSTMDEVRLVQGTPDQTYDLSSSYKPEYVAWHYGNSAVVRFLGGRVEGWTRSSVFVEIVLKAKIAPSGPVDENLHSFTVGSSKDEVLFVQGQPDSVETSDTDRWSYGAANVNFGNGRVVSWEHPNHAPLKANNITPERIQTEPPSSTPKSPEKCFTIGSTTDEVRLAQGEPDRTYKGIGGNGKLEGELWHYGQGIPWASVKFLGGRVESWESYQDNPLKAARIVPRGPVDETRQVFTVGSTKEEVLFVQGQPLTIQSRQAYDQTEAERLSGEPTTISSWVYGSTWPYHDYSEVFFRNDKVTRWTIGPVALKAK
jgi:outer membrane protein assembly factor BamE (lipoprotein component of BamABCDE complex)